MVSRERVLDMHTGEYEERYNPREWFDECMAYLYNPLYKRFLRKCYYEDMLPDEAVRRLRLEHGAKTQLEKQQERESVKALREANRRPPGRPKVRHDAASVQARIRAVLLRELAALELCDLADSARALVDATKRQVLGS